jgi:hypothetical protein
VGPAGAAEAHRLIAAGLGDVIGSDAHGARWNRWPRIDATHAALVTEYGRELADRLCCGSALGLDRDVAAA